jgi:hypothetical protein
MLEIIVTAVVASVSGLVVGLHILAPKTATKKDDELLSFLEKYGEPVVKEVAQFLAKR